MLGVHYLVCSEGGGQCGAGTELWWGEKVGWDGW